MPYLLRFFTADHLLVTTKHGTADEVGEALAACPVDELTDSAETGPCVRWEVVFSDRKGRERPMTPEIFQSLMVRHAEGNR